MKHRLGQTDLAGRHQRWIIANHWRRQQTAAIGTNFHGAEAGETFGPECSTVAGEYDHVFVKRVQGHRFGHEACGGPR